MKRFDRLIAEADAHIEDLRACEGALRAMRAAYFPKDAVLEFERDVESQRKKIAVTLRLALNEIDGRKATRS